MANPTPKLRGFLTLLLLLLLGTPISKADPKDSKENHQHPAPPVHQADDGLEPNPSPTFPALAAVSGSGESVIWKSQLRGLPYQEDFFERKCDLVDSITIVPIHDSSTLSLSSMAVINSVTSSPSPPSRFSQTAGTTSWAAGLQSICHHPWSTGPPVSFPSSIIVIEPIHDTSKTFSSSTQLPALAPTQAPVSLNSSTVTQSYLHPSTAVLWPDATHTTAHVENGLCPTALPRPAGGWSAPIRSVDAHLLIMCSSIHRLKVQRARRGKCGVH
jgi:hypothetical protein